MHSETTLQTTDAQRGLDRLCAHFRDDHDLHVDALGERAKIVFSEGWCALRADAGELTVHLKVWDEALRDNAERFIARHLQRLVLQSRSPVSWTHFWGDGLTDDDVPAVKLRMLAATLDQAALAAGRA
jgi:hypothetical protein